MNAVMDRHQVSLLENRIRCYEERHGTPSYEEAVPIHMSCEDGCIGGCKGGCQGGCEGTCSDSCDSGCKGPAQFT